MPSDDRQNPLTGGPFWSMDSNSRTAAGGPNGASIEGLRADHTRSPVSWGARHRKSISSPSGVSVGCRPGRKSRGSLKGEPALTRVARRIVPPIRLR